MGSLFQRLGRWRVGLQWYVIALLLPVGIHLVATGLYVLTGGGSLAAIQHAIQRGAGDTPLWLHVALLLLIFTLGFDGLGEELGWRGFALPYLLARQPALPASLVLGVFWAAWHLPYALTPDSALEHVPLLWFLLYVLASSIIHTWIFTGTRGSVLLAILFHAVNNTTANVLGLSDVRLYLFGLGLTAGVAVLLVATGRVSVARSARAPGDTRDEPVGAISAR